MGKAPYKGQINETDSRIRYDFIKITNPDRLIHDLTKVLRAAEKPLEITINMSDPITLNPADIAAFSGSKTASHIYSALRHELARR